MACEVALKTVILVQIFAIILSAYNYEILLRDEEIFSPCNGPDFIFIPDILDNSNLHFTLLENGSVHGYGQSFLTKDLGTQDNPMKMRAYRKQRNTWTHTLLNLERADACKSIFNKLEYWNSYLRDVPPEEQVCPFYKGKKFDYDCVADLTLSFPDPNLAGDYKLEVLINITELGKVFCTNIFAEIYRV